MPLKARRPSVLALALGSTITLAACGGTSLPVMSHSPRVHGAGKHFTFSAAHVPRSHWPDPCALLTRSAGQAALGTTITVRRFHTSCYYQPDSAEYPTLTITLLAVGTASDSSYRDTSESNKGLDRTSIGHLGDEAYLHPVRHLPATRLNVLTRYAHFAVTAQSPVGQKITAGRAKMLLVEVGRIVARAFRG